MLFFADKLAGSRLLTRMTERLHAIYPDERAENEIRDATSTIVPGYGDANPLISRKLFAG